MGGVIRIKHERPSRKLINGFMDIPTTIASDCMNRMNCMHAEIKPIVNNIKVVGSAVTVQSISGSNLMNHKAIYLSEPGDVIVIDARGDKNTAVWGYVQTYACLRQKIAGVVIDGCIRDVKEVRHHKYPLFCRGVSPAGPHKGWADNINVPISCGGAPVNPGDIIIGDDDGVVVVPKEIAADVLIQARERLKLEKSWFVKMKKGKTSLEAIGLDKIVDSMDVRYE